MYVYYLVLITTCSEMIYKDLSLHKENILVYNYLIFSFLCSKNFAELRQFFCVFTEPVCTRKRSNVLITRENVAL